MDKAVLQDTVEKLLPEAIEDDKIFVVEVEVKGATANPVFWVYLDNDDGGVSVDQCSAVSRKLRFLMEAHEVNNGNFTLNVSSPGLDKPLKNKRQYFSNKGRKSRVTYNEGDESKSVTGAIEQAGEETVTIRLDGKQTVEIPYEHIIETRILPAF